MFPSIDPAEVGLTGLLWLFLSYGGALYYAANMINEGSELLLLVPSMAGLVGGTVLPLLGALPDGAIILFSGLGDLEEAQESLTVGVGALAGSTIMLLTIPLALSVLSGRVDYDKNGPNYLRKPKLTEKDSWITELTQTGVSLTEVVKHASVIMMCTTLPYLLIQVPAFFLAGKNETLAAGEHWWALAGFVICLSGLAFYLKQQLQASREDEVRGKRVAVMKKQLQSGAISLSGAIAAELHAMADKESHELLATETTGLNAGGPGHDDLKPTPLIASYLKEILEDSFRAYDEDRNGQLDRNEVFVFFRDFNEAISENEMDELFQKFDSDKSGTIDLDEFIGLAYMLIQFQEGKVHGKASMRPAMRKSMAATAEGAFSEEEEEEMPEELAHLSPDQQQAAIKKKAFIMLATGSFFVMLFSDPMVDVLAAIGARAHISPFYVSFVLAPLASNASEFLAAQYYASKKTRKTITVALSALEGAACMNNTFCLSIFMGLIFFRGLAWQYTAETIAILTCQFLVGIVLQADNLTLGKAFLVLSFFPLSLGLVALLEFIGLD